MYTMATVAELTASAKAFQAKIGAGFDVRVNSYGIRVECTACHQSATHDRAYRFPYAHVC